MEKSTCVKKKYTTHFLKSILNEKKALDISELASLIKAPALRHDAFTTILRVQCLSIGSKSPGRATLQDAYS